MWLYGLVLGCGYSKQESLVAYGTALLIVNVVMAVSELLGVVGFLTWQYRVTRLAALIEVSQTSPRWAILSWFVPGMNLFKPYLMLRDLSRALGGAANRTGLVRAWWLTALLSLMLSAGYYAIHNIDEIADISPTARQVTHIIQTAVFLLAAALCIGVIWRIQRRLVQVKDELQLAP
ncbi:hypothetical protein WA016_01195 [Myxococcus stipitatus]